MSGDRTPAGIADAPISASACAEPSASTKTAQSHWRQERLTEARGILADNTQHPDTLVILACQVICAHSSDPDERTDALGMMRLLSACPPKTANAAPKGGAA